MVRREHLTAWDEEQNQGLHAQTHVVSLWALGCSTKRNVDPKSMISAGSSQLTFLGGLGIIYSFSFYSIETAETDAMGICKCKRRTDLYCYVHNKPVCDNCIVDHGLVRK